MGILLQAHERQGKIFSILVGQVNKTDDFEVKENEV